VSATVQSVSSTANWPVDLSHDEPSNLSLADSGIDDPVNDTGLGPLRGDLQLQDLQLSDEFTCLLSMVCEGRGEFS
jgi:hypothetical protein